MYNIKKKGEFYEKIRRNLKRRTINKKNITNKIIKMDKKLDEFYKKIEQEMVASIDEVIETIER